MNKLRPEILAVQILLGAIFIWGLYNLSTFLYIAIRSVFGNCTGAVLPILYSTITALSIWWFAYLMKTRGNIVLVALCAAVLLFFFPTLRSEVICHPLQKEDIIGWTSAVEDPNTGFYHDEMLYVSPFANSSVATFYARECNYNDDTWDMSLDLFGGEYRGFLFFRYLPATNFQVFHFVSVIVSGVMYVTILLVIRSKHYTTKQNEI